MLRRCKKSQRIVYIGNDGEGQLRHIFLEQAVITVIAFHEIKSMKVNDFIANQSELTVKVFEGFIDAFTYSTI